MDRQPAHGLKMKWADFPGALLQSGELLQAFNFLHEERTHVADTWLSREFRSGGLRNTNFLRRDPKGISASRVPAICSLSVARSFNEVRSACTTVISGIRKARTPLVKNGALNDKEYEFQKQFNGWWKCDRARGDKNTELAETMELGWLMRKGLDSVERLHVSYFYRE